MGGYSNPPSPVSVHGDPNTISGTGTLTDPLHLPDNIVFKGNVDHYITVEAPSSLDFGNTGSITIQAAPGANGDGTSGGFAGANLILKGGVGGSGDISFAAGGGSDVYFQGGDGGLDVGTGGGAGGNVGIDAGTPSSGGAKGAIYIGAFLAEFVKIGSTTIPTKIEGSATIGADTTPSASAVLDIISTTQGVLFPRMTTTQKNAISSPAEGLVIYDISLHKLCFFGNSTWHTITST